MGGAVSGDHAERLEAFVSSWQAAMDDDLVSEVIAVIDGRPLRKSDLRAALDGLEALRGDNAALLDGNQRLQTMNDGLRQMAIEAREAANGWHQATIDLYSGREEAAPQQAATFVEECDCGCRPGKPCLCPERDCYCGPCRVCDRDEAEQQFKPEPKLTDRQAKLLAAIRREGGDFSPLRARTELIEAGYAVTSERAHQIMKKLAERGYLEQVRPRAYTYRLKTEAPQQPERGGEAP